MKSFNMPGNFRFTLQKSVFMFFFLFYSKSVSSFSTMLLQPKLPPIVFVHGMKGCHLIKRPQINAYKIQTRNSPEKVWLDPSMLANIRNPELSLPLEWSGETQHFDDVIAGEAIDYIKLQVTSQKTINLASVYGPFLDKARTSGRDVFIFTWDWRRDLHEATILLEKFLESVLQESNGLPIQIVAHSMGGLLTLPIINRKPTLFAGVFFAGVPFGTGINYLQDIHAGNTVGLNRNLLPPHVLTTFSSHWLFFPENPLESDVVDAYGRTVPINFYDVNEWENLGLGIFNSKLYPDVDRKSHRNHLSKALQRAQMFRRLLVCNNEIECPPITIISGNQHKVVNQVLVKNEGPSSLEYKWDFRNGRAVPSDGRIDFDKSLPPNGIPYDLIASKATHVNLLNDNIPFLWSKIEAQAYQSLKNKNTLVF